MSNGSGHRWSKFWWQDWDRDMGLKVSSLAAQGLWMRLLCIAHEAEPAGHVTINGKPPTAQEIGGLVGAKPKEIQKLLEELEENGVFSRTKTGVIFNRRMVRDAGKSDEGAEKIERRWGNGEQAKATRAHRLAEARKKGTHTVYEWDAMLHLTGYKCLKCGVLAQDARGGLVRDHIVPVYQGGSDAIDNLQPMCGSCNAAKGPDTTDHRPQDWLEQLDKRLGDLGIKRQAGGHQTSRGGRHFTSSLEAEAEAEAEPPRSPPVSRGGRRRGGFAELQRRVQAAETAQIIDLTPEEVAENRDFLGRLRLVSGGSNG